MLITFVILISNIVFLFTSLYELTMLQQNSYNENRKFLHYYHEDITSKNTNTYVLRFLFALLLLLYTEFETYILIFYIFVMLILGINTYIIFKKHNKKLPLKFTSRLKRIILLDYLFFIILELLVIKMPIPFIAGCLLLYVAVNGYILMLIIMLLSPVEKLVFNHYKKQALDKLNKMPDLKIIGITGSFGKTSTKMILDSILKTTYKGFYTPASFNTPNGLLLTINREKTIFNDYFISEMGAKKKGEIKELCDLVHPKYGILTSIGEAHLETFKSLDNICHTKFELIESLGKEGVGILNKDDAYQRKYKLKNKCKVIWIGIDKAADVMAKDIKISSKGTSFTVTFKDPKENDFKVSTILLGNKNVYNILASIALAKHLGVPNKNIIKGVKEIAPIEHRLEIREYKNITIIDDSFNSNPKGAKNAVDVLGLMDGKKIIITPGMIEMGEQEEKLNYDFGTQIAEVADEVYLIGKKRSKPIHDGLLSKKYSEDKIKVFNSFKEAYNDVVQNSGNRKCTLLIENDLPDSYTEE